MNYTKGEWKRYGNEIILAGSGARIAEVNSGWPKSELLANARLISAAPVMHELLKWVIDRVNYFGNLDSVRDEEIIERIEQTLLKIDGK